MPSKKPPSIRKHNPALEGEEPGERPLPAADAANAEPGTIELPPDPRNPAYQHEILFAHRLRAARIPQRYAAKTFEAFKTPDKFRKDLVHSARAYVKSFNFAKEFPKGLLMSGGVGCGKSHLAVAILRGVIEKGYSGLYYNSPDLLRDIRATFQEGSEVTEEMLLEQVTSVDLLVFDDLGAERMTEFVLDRFYLIINERYEGCKPVIVTTNLKVEELEERLSSRIVSRLMEMCEIFGPFPAEDWRRRNMQGK